MSCTGSAVADSMESLPRVDDAIFDAAFTALIDEPWLYADAQWGLDARIALAWHHVTGTPGPPPIRVVTDRAHRLVTGDIGPYVMARMDAAGWGAERTATGATPRDEDELAAAIGCTWEELRERMRAGLPIAADRRELGIATGWDFDVDAATGAREFEMEHGGDVGDWLTEIETGADLRDVISMLSPSLCAPSERPPARRYLGADWEEGQRFCTSSLYSDNRKPHQRPRLPRRRRRH